MMGSQVESVWCGAGWWRGIKIKPPPGNVREEGAVRQSGSDRRKVQGGPAVQRGVGE